MTALRSLIPAAWPWHVPAVALPRLLASVRLRARQTSREPAQRRSRQPRPAAPGEVGAAGEGRSPRSTSFRARRSASARKSSPMLKVKNTSTGSIDLLKIDEYWYDRKRRAGRPATSKYRKPFLPGEVIEVEHASRRSTRSRTSIRSTVLPRQRQDRSARRSRRSSKVQSPTGPLRAVRGGLQSRA